MDEPGDAEHAPGQAGSVVLIWVDNRESRFAIPGGRAAAPAKPPRRTDAVLRARAPAGPAPEPAAGGTPE